MRSWKRKEPTPSVMILDYCYARRNDKSGRWDIFGAKDYDFLASEVAVHDVLQLMGLFNRHIRAERELDLTENGFQPKAVANYFKIIEGRA